MALTVLYTACRRYGVPDHLISDKGGAYISDDFEGVCTRLGIDHQNHYQHRRRELQEPDGDAFQYPAALV